MSGLFTSRNFSLDETPSLDGKVALITGGQAEMTTQLLLRSIHKVYILATNISKFETSKEEWRHRGIHLGEADERVEFVRCDLADIKDVKSVGESLKQTMGRLDILICNAGMGITPIPTLTPTFIETVFATNCVGHQLLVTTLLPLLKETTKSFSTDVRIIVASSSMHALCRSLDFELLTSSRSRAYFDGPWRYARSKLGNILFTKELARRLSEDGDPAARGVYVNAYFPGNIVTEQWGSWDMYLGKFLAGILRAFFSRFGQSLEDGAATAMYLAASGRVREEGVTGEYFVPIAKRCETSALSRDGELARGLWDWIEHKANEVLEASGQETDSQVHSSTVRERRAF